MSLVTSRRPAVVSVIPMITLSSAPRDDPAVVSWTFCCAPGESVFRGLFRDGVGRSRQNFLIFSLEPACVRERESSERARLRCARKQRSRSRFFRREIIVPSVALPFAPLPLMARPRRNTDGSVRRNEWRTGDYRRVAVFPSATRRDTTRRGAVC